MSSPVQFAPFSSFLDAGFWSDLTDRKLNYYKLDDSARDFWASYCNSDAPGVPCRLSVDFNALDTSAKTPSNAFRVSGRLILTNTVEQFKELPRKEILQLAGEQVWSAIRDGSALKNPALLSSSMFTCFADLKKYHYFYWIAHPALLYPAELKHLSPVRHLGDPEAFSAEETGKLVELLRNHLQSNQDPAFLLRLNGTSTETVSFSSIADKSFDTKEALLIFCDPSTFPENPGWPLRNILACIAYHRPDISHLGVLCWRQRYAKGALDYSNSILLNIGFAPSSSDVCPNTVGWEKNDKKIAAPRFVDMSSSMDSVKLAEGAVDLNLQLMRWRLVPELDLDHMKNLRCLLFGSGTLGCNVARNLLAWGVRTLTFIDNGTVSYSNPVRQSLFQFQDSVDKRPKAEAAADSIRRIFPGANARGLQLTVPMPGHLVTEKDEQDVKNTIAMIETLVIEHDVLFMLMDSREGRWLPTLLAALHSKLAFSVALGFDSYVIIRHGFRSKDIPQGLGATLSPSGDPGQMLSGDQLGCYFCSDVTAPGNSLHDRSLDQQCTVTRPGVSMMAASIAVEILSSLVQHPLHGLAPAPTRNNPANLLDDAENPEALSCLGMVPHQVRGYVSRFSQMTPCVRRFASCIACSEAVTAAYQKSGWNFLKAVFNSPKTLEDVTGLAQLLETTDSMEVWELSDTESLKSMD